MIEQINDNIFFNILFTIPISLFVIAILSYLNQVELKNRKLLIYSLLHSVVVSQLLTLISSTMALDNTILMYKLTIYLSIYIITSIVMILLVKKISLHLIGTVALSYFLCELLLLISNLFVDSILNLIATNYYVLTLVFAYVFIIGSFFVLLYVFKKINFNIFFMSFYKYKLSSFILTITLLLLSVSPIIFSSIFPKINNDYPYLLIPIQLIIVMLSLFYVAFYLNTRERVIAQEALLIEQDNYLNTLEQIQNEMKIFQQDYKNMLSELYLCAKSGNAASIQEYISKSIISVDKSLADKIRKTTNLANIQITELKSLILTKLVIIEQRNIIFELEVMKKINSVPMDTTNLIRCLGILIDNAIEACSDNNDVIKLILSNEKDSLLIVISNPIKDNPSIVNIWNEGYSTKGKNRGLGLYSYQKIINNYPNIYKQLVIENNLFTQILRIKNI